MVYNLLETSKTFKKRTTANILIKLSKSSKQFSFLLTFQNDHEGLCEMNTYSEFELDENENK